MGKSVCLEAGMTVLRDATGVLTAPALAAADAAALAVAAAALTALAAAFAFAVPALTACLVACTWPALAHTCCSQLKACKVQETQAGVEAISHQLMSWL
jgi:hypothetical protein